MSAPASDAEIIAKSLISFLPGLSIEEIEDYLPDNFVSDSFKEKQKAGIGITELKLKNDFALALEKNKVLAEHDTIAYLAGNMTKLASGEEMVFQIVLTPITDSAHGKIMKRVLEIENKIYTNQPLSGELHKSAIEASLSWPAAVFEWLGGLVGAFARTVSDVIGHFLGGSQEYHDPVSQRSTLLAAQRQEIINPYEQELQIRVKEKLGQPMFETSLRLYVRVKNKREYGLRVSGFLASLGQLSGRHQSLVVKSPGWFTSVKSVLSAFQGRELSSAHNPILSASELADLYHFPYAGTTKTEDLVKSKNNPLPAPLSFKQASTEFDNVFAKNLYGGSETLIGQTLEERRRHTYILGATGSGKTTLLSTMIYNDIANGKGVAVVDPHGQLVENLLRVIPEERIKDVVWFAPDDDGYPVALNLLELEYDNTLTSSQLEKRKSLVVSSIVSIIKKFYPVNSFGPRMEYVLKNAILTALETPEPTLQTVLDILTKEAYRKEVMKTLENETLKDYWTYEFAKYGDLQRNTVVSPITNKIGGLLSSPINRNILLQKKSKLDFDEVLNSGKILLCDLSKGKIGEDESSFFGSLVIAKIQLAALSRARIPEEKRKDFYLYVDEFQNFATKSFGELVSEARKYRLSTILAHQSISQIEDQNIVKTILANVGTVICFRTANPEDEQFILPIFSPEVSKHEIGNLPLYNFYLKISVGKPQDAFLAQADDFTIESNEKTAEDTINRSRKQYAVPVETLKKPRAVKTENEEIKKVKTKAIAKKPIKQPETEPELEPKTESENGKIWW